MYIDMYVSIGLIIFDIAFFFGFPQFPIRIPSGGTDTIESKKSYPLSEKDWFFTRWSIIVW